MKKLLVVPFLLMLAVAVMAIPAKRGLWSTITLADGTQVYAELRGDEHLHYMQDADGNLYVEDSIAYRITDREELTAMRNHAVVRRSPGKVISASTSDGLGEYGTMSRGAVPSIGEYTIPVIMVQFSDATFKSTTTVEKMRRYYNEEGYSDESGCVGSVRDYFKSQSNGMFVPTFDVVGIVTLSQSYTVYGQDSGSNTDYNIYQLPRDAVSAAVTQLGIDFSKYVIPAADANHSAGVPLVCILYAGKGQATESQTSANKSLIWPCEWDCNEDMSGTHFNSWFVGNELYTGGSSLMGIGVFCHEFSHALGLPDFYCTNSSYSRDDALSDWSIMDTGSYVSSGYAPIGYSAYEKSYMGWLKLVELQGEGSKTLQSPAGAGEGSAFIIRNSSTETFILENRQPGTWYPQTTHGSGLMLSRIAYNSSRWANNTVNNVQSAKRAMIVTANQTKLYYSSSPANLYGNGVNSITSLSLFDGSTKKVNISKIVKNDNGTISFVVGDANAGDDEVGKTLFYESFNQCTGNGGNDEYWVVQSPVADAFLADNQGWTEAHYRNYGGDRCAFFGTAAFAGAATTPEFTMGAAADFSFKAAAWGADIYDGTTLSLSVSSGTISPSTVALTHGEWNTYTASIVTTGKVKVTFAIDKGRFFLDEVLAVSAAAPTAIRNIEVDAQEPMDSRKAMDMRKNADNRIYGIDGRYMGTDINALRPGIYIVNGRKVVK